MLIVDQLKKGDRPLQIIAATILVGVMILLLGLWYVQVIAAQRFRTDLQVQSFRTVRVPALRGKILDRNRIPLADNRPSYNINLYLEELRAQFREEYTNHVKKEFLAANRGQTILDHKKIEELENQARYRVVSNLLSQISNSLQEPQVLIEKAFDRHYLEQRSLPFPLIRDLKPQQIAAFVEQANQFPGLELEVQGVRVYPYKTLAAHLLGHLQRDDNPGDDEDIAFRFRLPDYVGARGIEAAFDKELRGRAGLKSVLVNSMAYRQREDTIVEPEAGKNVVLTIDLAIQQAAERGLAAINPNGTNTRGAAVVMNVSTGDILAMASSPTFDPTYFVVPPPREEWNKILEQWNDEKLRPMFNRAAYGTFPAGSTFKIIVALAGLESGILNPSDVYESKGYYQLGGRGRPIRDTAGEGKFDFERAFYKSSNPYFIHHGLQIGAERLIEMGHRFRFGEPTGLAGR